MTTRLLLFGALMAIGTVAACTEAEPCPWYIDVASSGIASPDQEEWNFTEGEWVQADIFNFDTERVHTLTFMGKTWTVHPLSNAVTMPFQMQAGVHELRDEPSGDTIVISVAALPESTATPGPVWVVVAALAFARLVSRKK